MNKRLRSAVRRFKRLFPTEHHCIDYLYKMKWPNGFRCPRCNGCRAYTIRTRQLPVYQCRTCAHQTSLTANTILEKSRTPLSKWMLAMYLLACSYTNGAVNALQIASILEVTYKTAWSMLRKIRTAVSAYDRQSPLEGNIIAACIQYGFLSGLTNRPQPQVSPVSVCIGQASSSGGYIKIKMIPKEHLLSNRMLPSAKDWIAGQHAAGKANRLHVITQPVYAIEDMKVIRELASSARAWLNAAYHGLGKKYLQSYFDMFCFVYNTKRRSLSAVMQKLASLCVQSAACVIKS